MKIHNHEQEAAISHEIAAIMSLLVVQPRSLNDYIKTMPFQF